jgi:hypothetical protein
MAFLMTDVVAGSNAARALQQNVYGAQYDQANIAAAAEQNQLKLQQDRIKTMYAPEEAKLKLEQDQLGIEKTRLANLVADTGFKASQESKQKLKELTETEEFKTADDAGKVRLWAMTEAKVSGDPTKLASNLQAAEILDAKAIATKQKQLDQNAQVIGNAYGVIAALPDDKIDEFVGRLPEENRKALIGQIGETNWSKMTGTEKKEAAKNLMFNAKGQLSNQLKQIEVEKAELLAKSRERIEQIRQDGLLNRKLTGGTDREMRDWNLYNKASENIERSGKKTLDKLNEAVDAADAAQEKSKVGLLWNSSQPSEKAAIDYRKAVEARDKFQREQIKKQLNLATTAPDFPGKQAVVDNLAKELELFPEPAAPKESKPEAGNKPAAKAEPTATPATAKPGATSNKPTAKLTPEQNNAAITKANEAIKNGADPEKVKARLKEAGVSFKE